MRGLLAAEQQAEALTDQFASGYERHFSAAYAEQFPKASFIAVRFGLVLTVAPLYIRVVTTHSVPPFSGSGQLWTTVLRAYGGPSLFGPPAIHPPLARRAAVGPARIIRNRLSTASDSPHGGASVLGQSPVSVEELAPR